MAERNMWGNYVQCLKKYYTFKGRASRYEYWAFILVSFIIALILSVVDAFLGSSILSSLYLLATLFPSLAVLVRRMHDVGKSAWWAFSPWLVFAVLAVLAMISAVVEYAVGPMAGTAWGSFKTVVFVLGPIVAIVLNIVVLVFAIFKGDEKANQYGEPVA